MESAPRHGRSPAASFRKTGSELRNRVVGVVSMMGRQRGLRTNLCRRIPARLDR